MSSEPGIEPPLSPERFQGILRASLPGSGIELPDALVSALAAYLAELDVWRRRINLTGNLSTAELVQHALEALLPINLIAHGERVVDIGSGAGFPGFPLAIARPDLQVTLVEPRGKKCAFLRHVTRTLGLSNVAVFEGRVQEVGGQTFRAATTRALGDIPGWLGEGGLLEPGGLLLAWTTAGGELAAALAGAFSEAGSITTPGSLRRRIALFRRR
jgi:16S rRNA (guanine527-N7)-methyltransferase